MSLKDSITTNEAAILVNKNKRHIQYLCKNKFIDAKKFENGTWILSKKSLLAYYENLNRGKKNAVTFREIKES